MRKDAPKNQRQAKVANSSADPALQADSATFDITKAAADLTEAHLLDTLRHREAQRQSATKEPEFLLDEEKLLSMDALVRRWKLEGQRLWSEREELKLADFEALGNLTSDQLLLPRRDIKRIIYNRKNEVWAGHMRTAGKQIHECDICHRLHIGEGHACIATKWTTANANRSMPQ